MAQADNLSLFWYRRICEWSIFIGLIFIGIFLFFSFNEQAGLAPALQISLPLAIAAMAITVLGVIGRFLAPRNPNFLGWVTFLLNSAFIFFIAVTTGGQTSPYVALWLIAALGSGIIGWRGILVFFLATNLYFGIGIQLEWWGNFDLSQIIFMIVAGNIPVVIGLFLWYAGVFQARGKSKDEISTISEQLSREASKSELIINAIDEGVAVIDKNGILQLLNPAGGQITGWSIDDALNLDYKSVIKFTDHQDQPLEEDDAIQKVLKSGETEIDNDLTLTTATGKKILLSLIVSPINSKDSSPTGAIAVFRDITSEKKEEREKEEFISTASHEMRTPVASIEGYISLALNPKVANIDDHAREYLTKAYDATKHLGRLFQDLLTISKAEDGRLSNNPRVIEVVDFVRRLWEGQQQKAIQKNLQYNFLPDKGIGKGDAKVVSPILYSLFDPDRLSEVVNNLIDNAIKYTPEGQVSVDVTADPENIIIGVRDTGVGISKEDIPHLFQKFYRVDSSYIREVGGTGLGLYISRKILEQIGGQIWVESEIGSGSTFFVKIPRVDAEEAELIQERAEAEKRLQQTKVAQPEPKRQIGYVPESARDFAKKLE